MYYDLNPKISKMYARMGPRATYGSSMYTALKENEDFLLLSADLGKACGLDRLKAEFPNQFINCGIAEQNMVAFASGLAREGETVFASSFAPFLSMRASEHVRMNLGYMNEPVVLVAAGSGLSLGFLGNSHFGLEDVSVMRAIPGMTVICPADAGSIPKFIKAAAELKKPVYMRLVGVPGSPIAYEEDYNLEIGKINKVLSKGNDVAIIASGSSVAQSIIASRELEKASISVSVFDCHTIKPLDKNRLQKIFNTFRILITVEEHTLIGGLYSAISEYKSYENFTNKLVGIGIKDTWVKTGSYDFMIKDCGLDGDSIAKRIQAEIKN